MNATVSRHRTRPLRGPGGLNLYIDFIIYIYKLHLSCYIIIIFIYEPIFMKPYMKVAHRTLITRKILRLGYLNNNCHGNQ